MRRSVFLILTLLWTILTYAQTASFSADATSGCSPLVVNFRDLSQGNPTSWFWDFGNGATSTLKNPSTTYFNVGVYTVRLTVSNSRGSNTVTKTAFITIYGKPTVRFTASDSVGCYPFRIQFKDSSSAYAGTQNVNWIWDFGTGVQSYVQNPLNVFTQSGNYTITLKVTNDKGCYSVASKPAYIKISGGIQSGFSETQPNVCKPPFNITFTNNSTGPGNLTYLWDFGDGTKSSIINPTHKYTTPGNYTVTLATTSSNGCSDTLSKVNELQLLDIKTNYAAPDSVCFKSPVVFQNTSTPQPVSSNWILGDGTTSNAISPIKVYNAVNTYTVTLYNTYAYCTDSFTKTVKVLPRPSAGFKADNTIKCQPPFLVNFQDLSTNAVKWHWDFGDSTSSTNSNPSHTYLKLGEYTVTLIVTNSSGCTDTLKMDSLIKIVKPVISFPNLPVKGCVPYPVNFASVISTLDNVTSYSWDFGDGSPTSTLPNPSHTYTVQGTYTVTLTITTSTGCTVVDSMPSAVMVGTIPIVDFKASPIPNCASDPVNFNDLTIFNPNTGQKLFSWDFGDGSTSNSQNPSHSYNNVGPFTIKLTVTNNGCPATATKTNYVNVNPPIAKFQFVTDCNDKHIAHFTDASIGATSLDWDFGDGSAIDHSSTPSHTYPSYGKYNVTLTAHNGSCSYKLTQTVSLINSNPDFKADVTAICKTATITFTASAPGGGIAYYNWDYGNGNTGSGTVAKNIYDKSGYYDVTLFAVDQNNCPYTVTKPKYIRIKGPTAQFNSINSKGCKGLTANFTDQSTDDGSSKIVRWKWNFGDGNIIFANGSSQHYYPNPGTFPVQLTVYDQSGCSDSLTIPDLVVTTVPHADFVADTLACPNSDVYFQNLSSAINFSTQWSFGDGQTSGTFSPTIRYASNGTYTVKLKIVDQYGCADTMTKNAYIKVKSPIAAFTMSDSISSCPPLLVNFTNTSTYYTSSTWDLGIGMSNITSPVEFYVTPGVYNVKLTVTSPGGCVDSAKNVIHLYDTVGSIVKYKPLNGCTPLNVAVNTFSKGPVMYTWDFGDGNVIDSSFSTTNHVYHAFGSFIPKVIMTDPSGCVIPVAGTDTIHIIGATAKFGADKKLFCDIGTVNFLDSTTFNDPIVSYTWNFGDGSSSNLHAPSHQYASPGNYIVSLSILTKSNCTDTFTLPNVIKVVESPSISITGDSVACLNDPMQHFGVFNKTDTSKVTWFWQFPNGATSTVQDPLVQHYNKSGILQVMSVATNTSDCKDTAYKNILVNPLPVVKMPSAMTIQSGFPLQIPATFSSNVTNYLWTPPTGLSCTDCPQPVAGPKFNTKYQVSFVDSNGCHNTAEIQIVVVCKNANVFVPNTFSPNGDGMNDVFYVRGKGLERVKSLRIFNRWGQIVFEQTNFPVNDPLYGWNGTFKGNQAVPDVYVYQLEVFCENSQVIRFDGNVALIK